MTVQFIVVYKYSDDAKKVLCHCQSLSLQFFKQDKNNYLIECVV